VLEVSRLALWGSQTSRGGGAERAKPQSEVRGACKEAAHVAAEGAQDAIEDA
jgi:hypothetical protein